MVITENKFRYEIYHSIRKQELNRENPEYIYLLFKGFHLFDCIPGNVFTYYDIPLYFGIKSESPFTHAFDHSSLLFLTDPEIVLGTNRNKKHIDASVKERPQTLLVPSEKNCKRVL